MRWSPPVRMNRSGGRQIGQRHVPGDGGFVDLIGPKPAGGHVFGQRARGLGDVLAAAVAGGDGQVQRVVAGGALLGVAHLREDFGGRSAGVRR